MDFNIKKTTQKDLFEIISRDPVSTVNDFGLGYSLYYYLIIEVDIKIKTRKPKLVLCTKEEIESKESADEYEVDKILKHFKRRRNIEKLLDELFEQVKRRMTSGEQKREE